MNMTNNFLSTFPSLSHSNNRNQYFLNENIIPNHNSSNDQYERFHHSSQMTMSTIMCVPSLTTHFNDQHPYTFDHHQQIITENTDQSQQTITTDTPNLFSNHFNEEEHCQICGDLASGWHCGAITCEACKKFFLRSISMGDPKKKYKCQKNFSCSITKRSRTQCQYCRFEKCLFVGMKSHETVGPKTEELYRTLPCLVCGASSSGIHFGAVTCEACKGFFRRSVKENAPERYHCAENNNCLILSTSKISCRACRFRKCLGVGMAMDASRIGRQSNLFKQNIRQIQNGSTSMATVIDSARIASMAKRRKSKSKIGKVFASNNEIDVELSPTTKEFIEKVHHAYIMHLKNLPRCIPRETIWWTMASQMIIYAEAVMNFCQKIIPGFDTMREKYDLISSCINSVIMISLFPDRLSMKGSYMNNEFSWNYWHAESTLSIELNAHVPQLTEVENAFRSFELKLQNLRLDEKELSLLLLMIITRTNLNGSNEENKLWSKCQYECVQSFSEYTQARRSNMTGELPFEFYDIVFLVSQFRLLNRRLNKCLMNLPWPYIRNLPTYFYRIYLPSINNMSSILNSNYDPLSFSPIKSTINSTNRYENEFFSDNLNSNSIDNNNFIFPSNNEINIWSNPQTTWYVPDRQSTDDITVSIRW